MSNGVKALADDPHAMQQIRADRAGQVGWEPTLSDIDAKPIYGQEQWQAHGIRWARLWGKLRTVVQQNRSRARSRTG